MYSGPDYGSFNLKECALRCLFYGSVTEVVHMDYPMISHALDRSWILHVSIAGSANGLICLVTRDLDFVLWNPSIRKYKKPPHPRPTLRYDGPIYGFGYDEFRNDYKVVGIFCNYYSDQVEVKIYSLKSDSWTRVDDCQDGLQFYGLGKFVTGKLHWPTDRMYEDWNIISFDLANQKWGNVEQPCYGQGDIALWLGVLGNDLSVFSDYYRIRVDVWVMKEYGVKESWTKMFTVNYPVDPVLDGHMFSLPSFMSNEGEIVAVF
ncbi:F-box/kelch-repeat protein At3g23880-like [Lycium ferocissimum]|uniref:F-box/kelch-repeat protein At3g23880-like n=1 Tax=Lycium ferocissimum TaxID=112874 RepID=UPI002816378D|nr:F-box/kelch-repeat protein At3g23880-like [Lycium ferocissimum]